MPAASAALDLDAIELDAGRVMDRLAGRIGQLERELAIAQETIDVLRRRLEA